MSSGTLFSDYFLSDGIALSADWQALDQHDLNGVTAVIKGLIEDFDERHRPNEANTESDLVEKLLELLGWGERLKQEKANERGRLDVPDYLLFRAADNKAAAARSASGRYRQGTAILEAKAWDVPLDKAELGEAGAPSTQILRYLGTVDVQSDGAIRFGILTNGRIWRLYDHKARSRLEGFVEIDLTEGAGLVVPATGASDDHAEQVLRRFLFLFGRNAFVPDAGGATRLTKAIANSRGFEARVTDSLADTVFATVFPDLANALADADPELPRKLSPAYLAELREAALTWLYRLLFVLYAEDRSLLPTRNRRDGLWAVRNELARAIDRGEGLSGTRTNHDRDLRDLWRQIDQGDDAIGLPPYNGGLFRADRSPLLDRAVMPDAALAPLLDALSRERLGERPRFINYRDLNVQHLGSVYERLLEFDLAEVDGRIAARPQTFARKTSGSYYTPEELVMLVIRRTVGPLLDERRQAFVQALADPQRKKQQADYRIGWLQQFDPASQFLELRIVDPAMGSGHFLVSLVDYLADQVMLATGEAAAEVEGYRSPLLDRLEAIRARIREQAEEHNWRIDDAQLIDRQLVRRIILKRVIHGVDKNPMAVELAKLSLWLHTFTVGAPLSFLDHHLRCGDSLFGEWVGQGMDRLERGGLFVTDDLKAAQLAIGEMATVEELTDADITEVKQSEQAFRSLEKDTAELSRKLALLQGYRWIEDTTESALKRAKALERESARTNDPERSLELQRQAWNMKRRGSALDVLLGGQLGELSAVLDYFYGRVGHLPKQTKPDDPALGPLTAAAKVAKASNFLAWELAFPNVWRDWRSAEPKGGFDAVIGNPPWDKLRFEEVPWFAARAEDIALAPRTSDRTRLIRELKNCNPDLLEDYERAVLYSGMAARMATLRKDKGGQFPLLGRGDVNLYSLFVERAQRLVHGTGLVGLLVPSGIASDLGASGFFRSISQGRLISLLDYENRGAGPGTRFFGDVDARFKFSAFVFGGKDRAAVTAECGFFLTATNDNDLADQTFPLTPADFQAVNPNTGTAPTFRTARDADLTTKVHGSFPVLLDRRPARPAPALRFQYERPFDMSGDSELFRAAVELEADGFYPIAGGSYRKGTLEYRPLYEGKMVQDFDHRAASVVVNPLNLHRPGQPENATEEQHGDAGWLPRPQFYVPCKAELDRWMIGLKDITASTNHRTVITTILPTGHTGHTLPVLRTDDLQTSLYLLANLNSFALDYIARQKVQTNHIMLYILEQLPVVPPQGYDRAFGSMTAREIVAREVLRLTYTAHDIAPFARDMGHIDDAGEVLPPFPWDEAERRQRRARLDALYFHLYGISHEDADYILSTFPIVRRHDEATHDRYLTRDLILHHMDALSAGDPDTEIVLT
ncbi:MAG: Eco57I restriction-modification methylase domain-containing protein [Sphingomicrobium sp.]